MLQYIVPLEVHPSQTWKVGRLVVLGQISHLMAGQSRVLSSIHSSLFIVYSFWSHSEAAITYGYPNRTVSAFQ